MGDIRNGARTFLNLMGKACRLSRFNGFRAGVVTILGADDAASLFAVWDPCCAVIDLLIGADNWYNQKDYASETGGSEDIGGT
jgi:hypothetical protein